MLFSRSTHRCLKSASSPAAVLTLLLLLLGCVSCTDAQVYDQSYSVKVSLRAWFFSKSAYCDGPEVSDFSCPSCRATTNVSDVILYENDIYDTQGFGLADHENRQIVLSFRGSSNIANWIANLVYGLTVYSPLLLGGTGGLANLTNPFCGGCEVHRGFLAAYRSLQATIVAHMNVLAVRYPEYNILVTGHSLGAALAELCMADLFASVPVLRNRQVLYYGFGEPRVGNPVYASWVHDVVKYGFAPGSALYRITHNRDPVPHLPPLSFGFRHSPNEIFYRGDDMNTYKTCADSTSKEDSRCSNDYLPINVFDHLSYLGVSNSCDGDVDAVNSATSLSASKYARLVWEYAKESMQ